MLRFLFAVVGGLISFSIVTGVFLLLTNGAGATIAFLKVFVSIFAAFATGLALAFAIFLGVQIGFAMYDEFFGNDRGDI